MLFDEILNDKVMAKDRNFNVVRKFAQKIIREFFRRAQSNPVLFAEVLFFKTDHAVDDINEPGSVHKALLQKAEYAEAARERRLNRRNNKNGDLEDEDEEEDEYQDGDIDTVPWTEAEDMLLRNYYGTYAQQGNVLRILQDFLLNEAQSERTEGAIGHHLKHLGLWKGPKRRRNVRNEAKHRVKPMELTRNQRKSIIFHCVHKASYRAQLQRDHDGDGDGDGDHDDTEDTLNRKCFEWAQRKLEGLRDVIDAAIAVSSEVLLDDVAIIPIDSHGFDVMDNRFLTDLLTKLGFLAPSKYTGTCWWRIPRELLSPSTL